MEAELLIAIGELPRWAEDLGEVLALARKILRCDVLEQPLEREKLCNLTEAQLRSRSHRPQDYYGQPHFMPEYADGAALLQLNRARCVAREAELKAVEAFTDREGNPTRVDILRAMNRMSSMLYILMIKLKSKEK